MNHRFRLITLVSGLLFLALNLLACHEKSASQQPTAEPNKASTPAHGMRAYVDPVSGEYVPPPPEQRQPPPAGAAAVAPAEVTPPREVTVPKGGVMIELGDQFRVDDKKSE